LANVTSATNLPDCRIEGWAGGRQSNNPPRAIRNGEPQASQLMEGDVVVVCPNLSKPDRFRLWVKGRGGLEEATSGGIRRVTDAEVTSLLAKPFFAALRPAALTHVVDDFGARQKAVVTTALKYFDKGAYVQYAPTGAVAEAVGYVPTFGERPESAGPGHTLYVTPLSFVNDVCRNALGVSLCDDPANTTVSNLVVAPPPGMLVFEYDIAKDHEFRRYGERTSWMWSIIEPGDVVAYMTDHPDKKGKPGKENAFVYLGDERNDGHPLYLHVVGDGAAAASDLIRSCGAIAKRNFNTLLHGKSVHHLKERSKVIVLRPAARLKSGR
jgi:hypothetical protein